jgi:hypothetical protein
MDGDLSKAMDKVTTGAGQPKRVFWSLGSPERLLKSSGASSDKTLSSLLGSAARPN